jgi:adenylate cyclase
MLKKLLLSPWTALLTLALVVGIRVADPTFVESVRLRYFDTLITSKAPTQNNIYTVNIDEASLDKYGQWPLPRVNYAEIIEDLYHRNAGLVVLNVLMAERDRTGGDRDLGAALKNYPVVLPSQPSAKTKNTPRVPGSAVIGSEHIGTLSQVEFPGLIANVPQLENSAAGVGIVNTFPEIDGVNRRMPLMVTVDDKLYPGLALETLRVATANSTFQVKLNENGVDYRRSRVHRHKSSVASFGRPLYICCRCR